MADRDGYFRLNVSAGVHDIGLAPSSYASPNVILFRKELAPTVRGTEKKGVWLDTRVINRKVLCAINRITSLITYGAAGVTFIERVGRPFRNGGRFCCGRCYVKCLLDEGWRAVYTSYRNGDSPGDDTCVYH